MVLCQFQAQALKSLAAPTFAPWGALCHHIRSLVTLLWRPHWEETPSVTGSGTEAQLSQCSLQVTDCNYERCQQNRPAEPRQPTDQTEGNGYGPGGHQVQSKA